MSSECSLLCSLQLWTLKYAGLHERDISIHSYQQKPPSTKQSILPFIHNTSSSSLTSDKTPKKATYYDEYNDYFTSRSLPFHISNKIFHNLRDKLNELDNLLSTLKLIRTIWLRIDTIFLAFSNGTFVFIYIDKISRTLKNISIDKTTLEKKFHITTTISDIYFNSYGFYILYETLSKIDIFRFNKPIHTFDSKFNLSNESIRLRTEELPPYSNTIPVRRWFDVNHDHRTITIWWSMLNEGISTSGHLIDGDKKKSRFNCLSIMFPVGNQDEKETIHSIQTETSNPYYCSATPSGLTTIEMNEHVDEKKKIIGEATGGMSRDEYIDNTAADILKRIPPQYDTSKVWKKFGGENISPTSVVLLQELDRFNNLTITMSKSLTTLRRALKGEVGMSNELDDLSRALYNGQLPPMWRRLTPATKKNLANWMDHFLRRNQLYSGWINDGEPNVVWLSGLHIPESYLTALVQATCRKNGWPLDKSTLYTQVTQWETLEDVNERAHQGCFVTGLYLEGASWDIQRSCLTRQKPKVLIQELPVMKVIPIESHKLKLQNTFRCPVYVTSDRRNAMGVGLVFEADLATHEHISKWVLQGVCLILNTD
ncbi:unnamed protein product [Rotaria sordida]|uniref:Dynein heavy chain C-terminal domain-containing protein n=1 Tax=Rotaria sordida TaxID=392033 RepID=A0A818NWA3_9BILA|nr:unnamed protein product [Rotaria sordida]